MTSPYTRNLLERPQPWRSWQGGVTALLGLYAVWLLVLVTTGHYPGNAFGYVWTMLIVITAVTTTVAWVSLYRVRHRSYRQSARIEADGSRRMS